MFTIAMEIDRFLQTSGKSYLELSMINFSQESNEQILKLANIIKTTPTLCEITFRGSFFSIYSIAEASRMKPLFEAIVKRSQSCILDELDLSSNKFSQSQGMLNLLIEFIPQIKVKKLNVVTSDFGIAPPERLPSVFLLLNAILKSPTLESFDCASNHLGNLPEAMWPELCKLLRAAPISTLELSGNGLKQTGRNLIGILTALGQNKNIRILDICRNKIGENDFFEEALLDLFKYSSAVEVDISGNELAFPAWDKVQSVFNCINQSPTLKYLDISDNEFDSMGYWDSRLFNVLINFVKNNKTLEKLRVEANGLPAKVTQQIRLAMQTHPTIRFNESNLAGNQGYQPISRKIATFGIMSQVKNETKDDSDNVIKAKRSESSGSSDSLDSTSSSGIDIKSTQKLVDPL